LSWYLIVRDTLNYNPTALPFDVPSNTPPSQICVNLDEEYGSFQNYLRSHGDFDGTLTAIRKDFKFMGPTGIYYFLYVVGEEVPPHEEFEATYRK
jgi:3-methyladenine DNA glycosylase Tag